MSKLEKSYRNWVFVLYPLEDPTHNAALKFIRENWSFAEITHNLDCNLDTGELKKVHTHVVVSFKSPVFASVIEKKLGIPVGEFNICSSLKGSLLYLVHHGEQDKHLYDINLVTGDLKTKLEGYLRSADKSYESVSVLDIITFVDSSDRLSIHQLLSYVCDNGLYDVYRRSQLTFLKLLEEHNRSVSQS